MTKARDIASASPAPSTVSATELGYLDGVTSPVQTQIDSKIGQATAINPSIVTAKGDLIVATGSGTVMAQPVGTDGQYLQADSTQADGVKWATVTIPPSVNVYGYKFTSGAGAGPYTVNNTFNTGTWTYTGTTSCNVKIGSNTGSSAIASTVFAASNASSATIDLAPGASFGTPTTTSVSQTPNGPAISNGSNLWLMPLTTGYLATSTNGTNWSMTSQVSTANGGMEMTGVAFGGGMWVAVSAQSYGEIFSSTNGSTWTSRVQPGNFNIFKDVVWGGTLFVALKFAGGNMTAFRSSNGTSWTESSAITTQSTNQLAFGNGTFVFFGTSSTKLPYTSTDGNTWTAGTTPFSTTHTVIGLVYGDKFVAVATDGNTYLASTSTNGTTWTTPVQIFATTASIPYRTLTANNSATYKYVMPYIYEGSTAGSLIMSTDGVTWVTRGISRFFNTLSANYLEGYSFAGGRYIAIGRDSANTRVAASSINSAGTITSDVYVSLTGPSTSTTTVV